jgi:hypothetical protein
MQYILADWSTSSDPSDEGAAVSAIIELLQDRADDPRYTTAWRKLVYEGDKTILGSDPLIGLWSIDIDPDWLDAIADDPRILVFPPE